MLIKDLQAGQGNANLEVEVISVETPREFDKYGKKLRVANAIVKDSSGQIKMSLWNEDIEKVQTGMTLKIENGYCSEFKGEKQITTGKFGKFMVL
jgi:replication factor A1